MYYALLFYQHAFLEFDCKVCDWLTQRCPLGKAIPAADGLDRCVLWLGTDHAHAALCMPGECQFHTTVHSGLKPRMKSYPAASYMLAWRLWASKLASIGSLLHSGALLAVLWFHSWAPRLPPPPLLPSLSFESSEDALFLDLSVREGQGPAPPPPVAEHQAIPYLP